MIPFESALERDFATVLEFSADVESYETQPVRVDYRASSGRRTSGYPDFLVKFRPGGGPPLLCDIKYRSELFARWKALKPRLKAARLFARDQGWDYCLKTEVEIRGTFLENARFLLPFARCAADPVHTEILIKMLAQLETTTVQGLLVACCQDEWNRAVLIPTLWCLVGQRGIGIDFDQPVGLNSVIWNPASA